MTFRVLSAYRLPDAVLFTDTTDPRHFPQRTFPSGLEVAAVLGSPFARSRLLGEKDGKKLVERIDASRPLFDSGSLYAEELHCLATLLGRPDPAAPAFLRDEGWQIKSAQTTLAGWAQLRHGWVLHAKQVERPTLSSTLREEKPSGFVEPVPEFFARLGRLCERTRHLLRRHGPFPRPRNGWPCSLPTCTG